jgi:cytoplasmic iron level regulating protein YaaA (DUF328/UPF0246 family)
MLILLPPSEGKKEPTTGKPLNLDRLFAHNELKEERQQALAASKKALAAPAKPAHEIYSGVLYQALDWDSLSATAKSRGEKSILIISALFGAVRITDLIPTYKAKIKTSLWKSALSHVLDGLGESVIVDCRSSTYTGVWTPPHEKTVLVRVFQIKAGKRSVITHMSKKYRGELTRALLQNPAAKEPQDVFVTAQKYFDCEFTPATVREPSKLDLLIHI